MQSVKLPAGSKKICFLLEETLFTRWWCHSSLPLNSINIFLWVWVHASTVILARRLNFSVSIKLAATLIKVEKKPQHWYLPVNIVGLNGSTEASFFFYTTWNERIWIWWQSLSCCLCCQGDGRMMKQISRDFDFWLIYNCWCFFLIFTCIVALLCYFNRVSDDCVVYGALERLSCHCFGFLVCSAVSSHIRLLFQVKNLW